MDAVNKCDKCGRCTVTIKYDVYQWIGFIQFAAFFLGIEYLLGFLPDKWNDGVNYVSGFMAFLFVLNLLSGRFEQAEIKPKAISTKILPLMWSSVVVVAAALCFNIFDLPLSRQTVVPTVLLLVVNVLLAFKVFKGNYTVYSDADKSATAA